ncbi:cadherin-like domain-containing protein [Nitrosopumilus sp. K4]|uniref:Ig-like domain-containing protein n=1 Tax=Nitrosopumilus sp. K4 TaxID=2795383 RepID=UPI001BA478A9|nr:cadherin-like domain-containing protein [Nitrosopumilus sp. K4]QUC64409.1 cadherin-like domain-containing protein [Nitrosopumilus sp. K4]
MQKFSGLFLIAILISGTLSSSFVFAQTAPTAKDDFVLTIENIPQTIPVLFNDSDIDGDSLSITSVAQPFSGATVILSGSTQIKYTPNNDFDGIDSFTYVVSDGQGGSDTATVTVTVKPNNGNIFEQILTVIQSLFAKVLHLEDEVTLLREENSALAMRISELESIVGDGIPSDNENNNGHEKVLVCHKDKKTISVSDNALSSHLKHGDVIGKCTENDDTNASKESVKNQIKEIKNDFKIKEEALKNDFKVKEKQFKNLLKDLKKDKKSKNNDDD